MLPECRNHIIHDVSLLLELKLSSSTPTRVLQKWGESCCDIRRWLKDARGGGVLHFVL